VPGKQNQRATRRVLRILTNAHKPGRACSPTPCRWCLPRCSSPRPFAAVLAPSTFAITEARSQQGGKPHLGERRKPWYLGEVDLRALRSADPGMSLLTAVEFTTLTLPSA
jgi:hypothetical protein